MNLCFLGDIRQVHVQKFITYFAKDNETHVISFDYIGDERVNSGMRYFQKIGTHIHLLRKSQLPLAPFTSRYLIHKINPDLLQAHFLTNYGFLGAFSGFHPFVSCAQGDDILIHPWQSKFYSFLVNTALQGSDHIICDGINEKKNLLDLEMPEDKISLIYPGIDMRLFHPSKRENRFHKTVFYPRGFDKIYDVDTLFRAMEIIHQNVNDVQFFLMGIGTEYDRFRETVRKSELKGSVKYLGSYPNNEIPQLLASSDVSISTALSDGGMPVSTIEAMACGVPVVSTDAGDVRLWIKDGINGYIVDKQDACGLADKVIELLSDDKKRNSFGTAARNSVEQTYDYQTEMKKVERLYYRLVQEK